MSMLIRRPWFPRRRVRATVRIKNKQFWDKFNTNKDKFPRLNLVLKSLERPDLVNASFSSAFTEIINYLKVEYPSEVGKKFKE